MATKFKPGDKVRRSNGDYGNLKEGDEVIVVSHVGNELKVENDKYGYETDNFTLVESKPEVINTYQIF